MERSQDKAGEITEDGLLGGRVRLRQPARGYRAGLDAALLAAALDLSPGEHALEAGCGVGGALVQAAARHPQARFVGVERDPTALRLADENVILNGIDGRVRLQLGEVASDARTPGLDGFEHAFANPPFFDDPATLRGPALERRGAWLADDGLEAWTAYLLAAVRLGGRVTVIHRADRLADLLRLLAHGGGSLAVRPIHPAPDIPAKRVIVRAIKGGRAPLRLLAPLILHGPDGRATPQAQAILQGDAALPFDDPDPVDRRTHVRSYDPGDAAELVELFRRSVREATGDHYTLSQRLAWAPDEIDTAVFAARRAAKPSWVAEIGGRLVGFIDLEPDGHIDMLYVSADHQRRGVASLLHRVVEAKARGQGLERLRTEASLSARGFFERRGFTVMTEQEVALRGERLINFRMEKRLD